jgi:uncharacterized membrane protein YphA (DoxX/SURF4 family)
MRALPFILRAAVGLVFIFAGVVKIAEPSAFAQNIDNYRLLPWAGCVALAFFLPWLELFCGTALLIGRLRHGATALVFTMLAAFAAALASAKLRGLNIHCGCFGNTYNSGVGREIVVVTLLAAALAAAHFLDKRRGSRSA